MINYNNLKLIEKNIKKMKKNFKHIYLQSNNLDYFIDKIFDNSIYISYFKDFFELEDHSDIPNKNMVFYELMTKNYDKSVFVPDTIKVELNNVYLKREIKYSMGQWRQNEINYIIYKLYAKYEYSSNETISEHSYKFESKIRDGSPDVLRKLDTYASFKHIDNSDMDIFMMKIPKDHSPVPMEVDGEYYKDISSKLDIFIVRNIDPIEYNNVYKNTYKFSPISNNTIKRLIFAINDNMNIIIDNILQSNGVSYWNLYLDIDISKYLYQHVENHRIAIASDIAEFLSYFRDECIVSLNFIENLYKTPTKKSGESLYYANPIDKHKLLSYDHLFYKSYNVANIIPFPNYNGTMVELLVGDNFFMIIIEYSIYMKRYYTTPSENITLNKNIVFTQKYESFKCMLYLDINKEDDEDPYEDLDNNEFMIFMESKNNKSLRKRLNLLIIEKLYIYSDNNITPLNNPARRDLYIQSDIIKLMDDMNYNIKTVDHTKTLSNILMNKSLSEYYEDQKDLDNNINGLNFILSSGTTYVVYEDISYRLIIDMNGGVTISGKNEQYIPNVYPTDKISEILTNTYGDELLEYIINNDIYYFVFDVVENEPKKVLFQYTKRHTESSWSVKNINLRITDLYYDNFDMYIKYISYKINLMIKELEKLNANVIIHIGPSDVKYIPNIHNIVINPDKYFDEAMFSNNPNCLIIRNILNMDELNKYFQDNNIKTYFTVLYNIYDTSLYNLFNALSSRTTYGIMIDLIIPDTIYHVEIPYKIHNSDDDDDIDIGNIHIESEFIDFIFKENKSLEIKLYDDISRDFTIYRKINVTGGRNVLNSTKGGIFIRNKTNIHMLSNNIFKILTNHIGIIIFKRDLSSIILTLDDILRDKTFKAMINRKSVSFEVIEINGILESIVYAIKGNLDYRDVQDLIDNMNYFKYLNNDIPELTHNMGYNYMEQIKYLSSFFKISFMIYDISNSNILKFQTNKYSKQIYFITDGVSLYPIKQDEKLMYQI